MSNDLTSFFGDNPFVPSEVKITSDFENIPPGKYPVLIETAEVKQNSKKTGHIVKLKLNILEDPHKGRKLFDNVNIDNPSADCVRIGTEHLALLGVAIGIEGKFTDTNQLVNQIVIAHVGVKNDQNFIRTYSAPGKITRTNAVPDSEPNSEPNSKTTTAAPQTETAPPWKR